MAENLRLPFGQRGEHGDSGRALRYLTPQRSAEFLARRSRQHRVTLGCVGDVRDELVERLTLVEQPFGTFVEASGEEQLILAGRHDEHSGPEVTERTHEVDSRQSAAEHEVQQDDVGSVIPSPVENEVPLQRGTGDRSRPEALALEGTRQGLRQDGVVVDDHHMRWSAGHATISPKRGVHRHGSRDTLRGMDEERSVVVAAKPAVLADAICRLLEEAGVDSVTNAIRTPTTRHFAVAVVTEELVALADADTVIVLPGQTSDQVIDLTVDVIDLVAAERSATRQCGA